eukprot:3501997-Amphidinium_carterae.2
MNCTAPICNLEDGPVWRTSRRTKLSVGVLFYQYARLPRNQFFHKVSSCVTKRHLAKQCLSHTHSTIWKTGSKASRLHLLGSMGTHAWPPREPNIKHCASHNSCERAKSSTHCQRVPLLNKKVPSFQNDATLEKLHLQQKLPTTRIFHTTHH